jgi:hypothetical protein
MLSCSPIPPSSPCTAHRTVLYLLSEARWWWPWPWRWMIFVLPVPVHATICIYVYTCCAEWKLQKYEDEF